MNTLFIYSQRGDYDCTPQYFLIPKENEVLLEDLRKLDGKVVNSSDEKEGIQTDEQQNISVEIHIAMEEEGPLLSFHLQSPKELIGKEFDEVLTLDFLL